MQCCYQGEPLIDSKWCKDLETVYTDDEGNEYCVFHAPQGCKGVSLAEFNELIFERILEAKKKKETCNLEGTIFEGSIGFSRFDIDNPLPSIYFYSAQFSEGSGFWGVHFSGGASFRETQFLGHADFGMARFNGNANFSRAQFSSNTRFWRTWFSRDTDFRITQFLGEAEFGHAQFNGKTDFREAHFRNNANFWEVELSGYADFRKAQFSEKVIFNFLHILENARLSFQGSDKPNTSLEKASFQNVDIEGSLMLESVDLSKVPFTNTQIHKIDFVNIRWPRSGWGAWRNTLYDEIDLF